MYASESIKGERTKQLDFGITHIRVEKAPEAPSSCLGEADRKMQAEGMSQVLRKSWVVRTLKVTNERDGWASGREWAGAKILVSNGTTSRKLLNTPKIHAGTS